MALEAILPVPVLVVEDEEIIQLRLRKILTDLGYANEVLLFAKNVKEAFAFLEQQPISLALIDLGLPDGNGPDRATGRSRYCGPEHPSECRSRQGRDGRF